MDLTPQDRDLTIRTVIGEAAGQPEAGQAGVAAVIMNRANSPNWGGSPSQVVLAPNQFEPWSTRARELLNIDPQSPQYQAIGRMVDGVASGSIPDPTGGATYFLNPDIVRARRGGSLPSWARGEGQRIGQHVFYGGSGPAVAQDAPGATGSPALGYTDDDVADTAKSLGLNVPELTTGATPAKSPAGYVPVSAPGPTISVPAGTAAPNAAPTDDDVAATAKTLGLKLDNPPRAATAKDTATPAPARPGPTPDASYTQELVEGMPVIGPLFNKAVAAGRAGLDPAINAIRSLVGKPPLPVAPTFGARYANNLADIQGQNQQFEAAHPVGSTIANLVGGGVAMGPAARITAAPFGIDMLSPAALTGVHGPTIASRVISGAAGGAGLGGLDAQLRGQSSIAGAELGAAGGGLGPLVGGGIRSAISGIGNYALPRVAALRNLTGGAVDRLLNAVEGETPQSMAENSTRMGPAGFVGDINPALTDIAGGIADTPGPGKQVVREAYQDRARGQRQRVDDAISDAYGIRAGINVNDFKNYLTETRAAAADPLYQQFRTMEVRPTDELKAMIPRLESAGAFNMAEELSNISGHPINKNYFTAGAQKAYPTAEAWDYVKRGVDRRIDQAYRAGDKTLGRELTKLKQELISEIEKTDAGKVWKQARTEFADRSAILDQLDAGKDDFIGGRSGLTADELAEELSTLSGPELAARKIGQRAAVEETMGRTRIGDTSLRNQLLAPNNTRKLELTLGKDKADQLVAALEQEKYLGDQHQNVVGGSQTTPKKERVNALAAPAMEPWDLDVTKPMTYLPPSMRREFTPHGLVNAWRGQGAAQTAEQLAPLITLPQIDPRHGALLRALLQERQRRVPWALGANRAAPALTALVSGPGATTARNRYLSGQPQPAQ